MNPKILIMAENLAGSVLSELHPEEREYHILAAMRRLRRQENERAEKHLTKPVARV